ncbi:MAG TPA: UDP-2,3-diacylglucosamine diphosphatase [Noviherbaspirillum sp.]|nr:UDP-2,3-diacylglucosamine diphosphatase [Noviherbaspirillum sp.]
MSASNSPLNLKNKAQPEPVALFVSDVHLQAALPRTTQAFIDFLRNHAIKAQQLYLLGDLFEYWAGDDDLATSYNAEIVHNIRGVSDAGVAIFWIPGNRDFLVGEDFARTAGLNLLPDPFIANIAGQRIVLTHGDAQCTDDQAYMAFRAQVREPAWQREFLAMPLAKRKALIEGMRNGSREAQRSKSYEIMDVNCAAIASLHETSGCAIMIHGHTHRPAIHEIQVNGEKQVRYVLPDWDCDTKPARGGWLALYADASFQSFCFDGAWA